MKQKLRERIDTIQAMGDTFTENPHAFSINAIVDMVKKMQGLIDDLEDEIIEIELDIIE